MTASSDHTSYSQIRRYEQCPKSFDLHYRQSLPRLPSDPATFGSVIHGTCERLVAEAIRDARVAPLSAERALALYRDEWTKHEISGASLFGEGITIMKHFVEDQGVLDPSSVLAVEQRFLLPLGRFVALGFIDRVNRIDDETIEIVDYKTNHQLFTREELDDDLQLPFYCAAARRLWPWAKKVKLTLWMLRHRLRVPVVRTAAQIDEAVAYAEAMAEKTATATTFPAKSGAHCAYCDHRVHCDTYAAMLQGNRRVVSADKDDLDAVAREREEVAGLARVLEGRKKELDGVLKTHLKTADDLRLAGMRYRMVTTRSPAEYPLTPTVTALTAATGQTREELVDLLAIVDKGALARLLDGLGERLPKPKLTMLRAELEARAIRTVSPRFRASEDAAG